MLLEITAHPDNKQAKIGSSVTLTCTSSISSSDVTFTWIHNGTITRQQQPINSDTSRLTISNVRYRDSGRYVCIVRKGPISMTSHNAIITVYGKLNDILRNSLSSNYYVVVAKPVIKIDPTNSEVKALTSVTFTCLASNINGVTHSYSWGRKNGDIPTRSTGQNTNTLTITRVVPPDEGMYYCIATNDGGSTSSRSASLTVDGE